MPEDTSKAVSDLKISVSFSRSNRRSGGASRSSSTCQEQINSGNRPGLSIMERNEVPNSAVIGALAGQVAGELFRSIVGRGLGPAAGIEETLRVRAALAFLAAGQMIITAVSPDVEALPGACVISTPSEAANCP